MQKKDFEIGRDSYFWGEWSREGWYSYYLLGLLIKEPLGLWILLLLVSICVIFIKSYRTNIYSEMILIAPVVMVLFLVSSQTNLNHHLRYTLPIFPFLFIFVSRLGKYDKKWCIVFVMSCSLAVWFILSSLCFFPHSQAYFNDLIGSPANAPKYLLDSNIDWGQDLFYLERWCKEHSEVKEIRTALWGSYPLESTLIPSVGMPSSKDPPPGWYALSVNYLYDRSEQYRYFLNFEPVARAGYSIYIYHITAEDADKVHTIPCCEK